MKQKLFPLCVTLLALVLCNTPLFAEDFTVGGIYYNIASSTDKTVAVMFRGSNEFSYSDEYSGAVTIPESVTYSGCTYSVTSIGYGAFYGCSNLTSVQIPNSVTSIGDWAFYDCSGLTSVVIGNSVTSIGHDAFYGCSSLTSVEIPNSVTSIGYRAFESCSNLRVVLNNSNLTFTKGSSSYGYIAYYANVVCNGYEQVDDFIFTEEDHANYLRAYIGNATELVLPTNYKGGNYGIGDYAFRECSGLTSVVIPNSVTSIGDNAFYNCSSLTSVEISNSVISIGIYAFYGCSSLTSIEIPNSVTSIGNSAFSNCSSLNSVEIPNSVTSIGSSAFSGCSRLNSVVIPNSVTSIGSSAFSGCSRLNSVVIPNSVTSIEENAFCYCDNLKSITSLNPTPPATTFYSSPFSNYDATLYVPFGAKDAYSEAEYWKNFANIEELVYELTDGEEYNEASDMTVEAVTYTRTLPNLHWNALYVPFELPYDVIADRYDVAYINDVNGYDTDDNGTIDDLAMEIIKIKGGTLKAHYPYLIKAKTEADKAISITVEDATLYAAAENSVDCSSVYQNYTVTGIYTKKTAEELAGKLAISTSGAWQPLAAGTALNPFRLYLSIENRDNSPLKVETVAMSRMRIVERGETTGVETIIPAQQREDVIIDLSGRRVKQPVKGGLYIVNGKKQIF